MNQIELVTVKGKHLIDLLNAEGPIMVAERRGEELWLVHRIHKVEQQTTPAQLRELMHGQWQWQLPNGSFVDMRIYPEDMKPSDEGLERFLDDARVKPLIYLASPYSHRDPAVMQDRYEQVCQAAADMVAEGQMAISPIAYGHTLLGYREMPGDWTFWESFCISLLAKCERIVVLKMDGWQESRGVQAEICYAEAHGIPVDYIEPPKL
jgi:hypothetical protein